MQRAPTRNVKHKPRAPRTSTGNAALPDWVLENYDPSTTEKPNVETEFRRLQALKTFALLDQPVEECYQRFTSIAARMFRAPMACLSLVDLGRTFFVAQTGFYSGLPDREVSRKTSFCAHAILCFDSVLVVKDALTDPRFENTPLVREHGVRFYAGAPLITPEGYRIGCLSILDTKPRPEGLSDEDCNMLVTMAASVMDLMLEKRLALQGASHAGLTFSYDVQRAASRLRESLHQLKDDFDFQTVASDLHRSLVQSACTTADHLHDSVVTTRKSHKRTNSHVVSNDSRSDGDDFMDCQEDSGGSMTSCTAAQSSSSGIRPDNPQMPAISSSPRIGEQTTVEVSKLVQNLVSAMEVFPKKVHLAFVVDPAVPKEFVCNDLKVFRSSIALLTSACERTERGFVRFHIYKKHVAGGLTSDSPAMIVFECEDSGRDVALEQFHQLFQTPKQEQLNDLQEGGEEECITVDPATGAVHQRSFCQVKKPPIDGGFAVYPVARYVESMGGEYGYLPRMARQYGGTDNSVPDTGSLFWFSIPLREAISSLDAAIGTALGLDDYSEEREVVGGENTDLRLSAQPRPKFF